MSGEREGSISSVPWRLIGSLAGIGGMLLLLLLALPKPEVAGPEVDAEVKTVDSAAAKCEQDLTRILQSLKPGDQGMLADRTEMVSQLNNWQVNCADGDTDSKVAHDAELLVKLLSEQELSVVNRERFVAQDSSHIRTCFLAQEIVKSVALPEKVDRARVVKLFEFVVRSVSLLPEEATSQLALTPYESLLFGRGDARHISWTFAALLKQLRLDAVVLRPSTEGKSGYWLIGVPVPRTGVLLFDPHLGMMIPSLEKEDPGYWPTIPATIEEARANEGVFRQFDNPELKYPLTAADLQNLTVEVIGDPSSWSPRMAQLQFLLAAEFTVEFYDGLGANDLRESGLWERVKAAGEQGGWTEDQMKVWRFPSEELARMEQMEGTSGNLLTGMMQVFSGPVVERPDRRTGMMRIGPIDHPLHETRLQQLVGNHSSAVTNFVPIRGAGLNSQVPMNQEAGDYAEYWIGVSQFELGRYEPALSTFRRYLESHPTGGQWSRDSLEWMVRCLLALNLPREAGGLLSNNISRQTAMRDVWLLNRWGKMLGLDAVAPRQEGSPAMPSPSSPAGGEVKTDPVETPSAARGADPKAGEDRPPAPPVPESGAEGVK